MVFTAAGSARYGGWLIVGLLLVRQSCRAQSLLVRFAGLAGLALYIFGVIQIFLQTGSHHLEPRI